MSNRIMEYITLRAALEGTWGDPSIPEEIANKCCDLAEELNAEAMRIELTDHYPHLAGVSIRLPVDSDGELLRQAKELMEFVRNKK